MKGQTFLGGCMMSLSVSTLVKENKEFILSSIQQMELKLQSSDNNDDIVRRAIFAVRNKHIYFDKFTSPKSLLQITVQDVRPAKVFINFQEQTIVCDCQKEGWCRHKVSSLLALYQFIDSVQDWHSNWRMKKNVSLEVLAAKRTPNSWKRMIQDVFSNYLKENQKMNSQLLIALKDLVFTKLMNYVPFEREWKPIYKLFMEVSALNIMWEHLEKTNSIIESRHFEQFFDEQFERIHALVEELKGTTRLFATDAFFDEMQVIIRNILLHRKGYEDRKIKLYCIFWDKIFTEKKRAKEELTILQESITFNTSAKIYSNLFYILLNDKESLERNMKIIKANEIPIDLHFANFAFSKNQFSCGEMILKAMLPLLHDYIHGHLEHQNRKQFVQTIHSLYEHLKLNEKEEMMLFSSYGAYGIQPYSNYLFKLKRYEDWIALHQIHPSSISYLESIGLQEVLEENPKAVLPLLHYYAVMEIEQKTRMNYKEAASILKKMKAACQKMGKMNFWTDYIYQLQMKFKRLKAFLEELERENILV